ncbi:MAG: hypothetical protein ACRELE_04195 [Gemmatimonadales bacterium]
MPTDPEHRINEVSVDEAMCYGAARCHRSGHQAADSGGAAAMSLPFRPQISPDPPDASNSSQTDNGLYVKRNTQRCFNATALAKNLRKLNNVWWLRPIHPRGHLSMSCASNLTEGRSFNRERP